MDLKDVADAVMPGGRRRTQRRPLACQACTRSKVRCDKVVPCARCKKRGIDCKRENVQLSTKYAKESLAVQTQEKGSATTDADIGVDTSTRLDHESLLHNEQTNTSTSISPAIELSSQSGEQSSDVVYVVPPVRYNESRQAEFEDLATAIEGLAWGRHQCHRFPHHDCLQVESTSIRSLASAVPYKLPSGHPPVDHARPLVDLHVRLLAWSHNVLHIPTFLDQCEHFWRSGVVEDIQWLATYYAVLSSAAWTLQNSQPNSWTQARLPHNDQAKQLFDLMIAILNDAKFMSRHSIFALQAICISGLVANVLGESDALTVLVNSAVRIGQCLGIHRISPSDPSESAAVFIEKEVGRRVWWKLVEMDCHSMPYTGSCCINMRHFTTRRPLNCDEDLLVRSESCLTSSTYSLVMMSMATLIPTLLDGLWTMGDSTARYEHVINMDRQVRALVGNIPSAIVRSNATSEDEPDWLPLARRTLAISAADKIIMIHRSFLVRSFQSPAYLFTRNTCVSAAITILREHEQIYENHETCPILWLHSAFCVTAIVVICLNMLYCRGQMSVERQLQFETMVRKARTRLSMNKTDTMARRGVFLVDALLHDNSQEAMSGDKAKGAPSRPEFFHILERFIQRDQPAAPLACDGATDGETQNTDDFDIWYNQTFG